MAITRSPASAGRNREADAKILQVTLTLAEINAGAVVVPGRTGKRLIVTDVLARAVGSFATGSAVVLEGTGGTDVWSGAQAQLTNGAFLHPTSTGVTRGAGWAEPLPTGEGLMVVKSTATAFTGGTSIAFTITYGVRRA